MRDHTRTIKEIAEMVGRKPKAVDACARYYKIAPEGIDLKDNKTRLFDPAPFLAYFNDGTKPAPETAAIDIPDECLDELTPRPSEDSFFMVPPLTPEIIAAYLQVFDRDGVQNILINNYGLNPYRTEE